MGVTKETQETSEDPPETLGPKDAPESGDATVSSSDDTIDPTETCDDPKNMAVPEGASCRPLLSSSRSVPLFASTKTAKEEDQEDSGDWNSEADLMEGQPMSTIQFSSTYRSPHKVQFAETAELSECQKGPPSKKKRWRSRTVSETSTVSCTSLSSATSSSVSSLPGAPDGGYGWVVVAASFFVNMIADGTTFSFGVMFHEFQDEFDCSKAATAGVVSVFHSVPLLTGPVATWLTDRYGCRNMTILGSLMAAAGFLAAAFSHNIYLLYLFFGVVAGFGLSLCYVAAIIIVAYYFDRRRSFATGISVCGSGVGTFLFAPFTQYLMDTYDGWRGACIILAGIFLNMAVCGMLFRDLPALTRRRKLGRGGSSRSLASGVSAIGTMPEIEELRKALESGDVSWLLKEETEQPRLASSLITLPTYIKNASKLPQDVLNLLANNQQTYNYIQENFPDSLIITRSKEELKLKLEKEKEEKVESTGVKLKRRVSSMMRTKSILKKKDFEDYEPPVPEEPLLVPVVLAAKTGAALGTEQRMQRLHNLRVRRQSLTYRGACLSTARYQMRASSCPDIYRNSMGDLAEEEESCLAECAHSLTQCCALNYFTLAFAVFCFSNFILYFWYDVPYVYTIEYAETMLPNISNSDSALILSMIGALNTVGEVLVGWVADLPWVNSNLLYASCMMVCGLVTAIVPFVHSYQLILVLSALYGLCISANYSLTSPILVELVSLDQFSSAYGFLLACQGVGNLIGPPVAGWLYDWTKEWYLTFALAGVFIAVSGALLLLLGSVQRARRCCAPSSDSSSETDTADRTAGQPIQV